MYINPINNCQTNFGKVTLVQIPKKEFANPENLSECSDIFTKKLDVLTKDNHYGLSGIISKHKTANLLESMSYIMTKVVMSRLGSNYSIEWAAQNVGLTIKKPVDENYHSFFIFTKEHLDIFKKALKDIKNLNKYSQEAQNKYPEEKGKIALYTFAKYGVEVDKILDLNGTNPPSETIKLNNLDELDSVVDKLDI